MEDNVSWDFAQLHCESLQQSAGILAHLEENGQFTTERDRESEVM